MWILYSQQILCTKYFSPIHRRSLLSGLPNQPHPLLKDLRDIHLRTISVHALCPAIASSPRLETIAVDEILPWLHAPAARSYSATLESMTLPLPSSHDSRQEFIDMFSLLHLPIFRKLTLVGAPTKQQTDCLLSMLAVASFQVSMVDFQTDVPLRKFHMNRIKSLLSVVGEVTLRGNVLQADEYRNSRLTGKLKLRFSRMSMHAQNTRR